MKKFPRHESHAGQVSGHALVELVARMSPDMPWFYYLLDQNVTLEERGEWGMTPLIRAAHQGHDKITEALIRAGANLDAKDDNDMTALHWALRKERMDILRALLAAGADPDVRDAGGDTPLAFAERKKSRLCTAFLAAACEAIALKKLDRIAHRGVGHEQQASPLPLMKKKPFRGGSAP